MTINITPEIEDAYRQFLAEQVDSFVGGQPIYRRDTAPYSTMRFSGLVDFAAGHQAARAALAAVQPPLAAQSEQPQANLAGGNGQAVCGDTGRGASLPLEIIAVAERLHTQNNRATSHPLFAVQQKRVIGGLGPEYADKFAWICDGLEVGADEAVRLDAGRAAGDRTPDGYDRVGYTEIWEFVTGCFTEQGCKDFIKVNGHNLKEPRIYAYSAYRNAEFIALREWLMTARPTA